MKELSIEEKAKRYDESLERAKKLKETCDSTAVIGWCEYIFNELRESEDEKIRKEIVRFIQMEVEDEIVGNKWIAWLEKKGQKETDPRYENLEELLAADDIYQMAMNDDMVQEAKTKAIDALSELEIGKLLGVEKKEPQVYETEDGEVITYSESEGYKVVEPKFKVGDWVVRGNITAQILDIQEQYYIGIDTNGNDFTSSRFLSDDKIHLWTIQDTKAGDVLADEYNNIGLYRGEKDDFWESYIYLGCNNNLYGFNIGGYHEYKNTKPATKEQRDLLFQNMKEEGCEWDAEKKEVKKIEQKPTDKVEPKFKVGDWVVQGCNILKIRCVGDEYYCYETVGGYVDDMLVSEIDSLYHLWTIKDAKYGDILSTDGGNIFIYTGHDDGYVYYCATTNYYDDAIIEKSTWNIADGILPASKSQVNFLISKIKEKGYRWDNKKKEIYKVVIDEGKSEMDYNFTRMMLKEQKQQSAKWSEDDENVIDETVSWLDTLCDYLRDSSSECIPDVKDAINRLKSLKERAIPQSKQDWTKEDDEMFDAIIADIHFTAHNHEDIVNQPIYEKEINWLSSIKNKLTYQQNQEWSEEDEIGLGDALWAIRQARTIAKDENDMGNLWYAERWLKLLKERIQSQSKYEWKQENTDALTDFENLMMHIGISFFGQHAGLDPNDTNAIKEQANILLGLVPKQEWGEEDEEMFKRALKYLKQSYYSEESVVSWLKTLKDRVQSQWKPGSQHIAALEYQVNTTCRGSWQYKYSKELLEQLKKL